MDLNKSLIVMTVLVELFVCSYAVAEKEAPTIDEIVKKSNHMALYQGIDSKGKVSMKISDNKGRIRKRTFNILRKDGIGDDKDQMYYTLFKRPADVRNMVFMIHKYTDLSRDDDRWLYLPGLDLVKRIAAGDKRTSFVGSDFLYEDISGRSPLEDDHQLISTTGTEYIIKNIPKRPESVEFTYYIVHVDKSTFLPLKIEFYKDNQRCYRVIETREIESIETVENGNTTTYPTVTVSVARDLETQSTTEMVFSDIQYNIGLDEALFSERFLRRPPRDALR